MGWLVAPLRPLAMPTISPLQVELKVTCIIIWHVAVHGGTAQRARSAALLLLLQHTGVAQLPPTGACLDA